MMIRLVPKLVAFAVLVTTTSAFAQSGGPPAGDYRGPGDSVPMSRFDLNESAQRDVRQRMGPDQRRLELVQTTLLNRFAALGFAELIDIDKAGVNYLARVRTVNGETVNVTIDPMSGEIIGMQPVAVIVAAEPQPGTTARTPQSGSSGSGSSGGGEYASMGSCQPAGWASLSDRIDQLPQNKQLTANRLMRQIWENYSDGDSIACREKLEDLSDMVRSASAR
jgi:hypothetical protein